MFLKHVIFYFILVQAFGTGLENVSLPDWDIFEFITKKVGRCGPSKEECIDNYNDKLVFLMII